MRIIENEVVSIQSSNEEIMANHFGPWVTVGDGAKNEKKIPSGNLRPSFQKQKCSVLWYVFLI